MFPRLAGSRRPAAPAPRRAPRQSCLSCREARDERLPARRSPRSAGSSTRSWGRVLNAALFAAVVYPLSLKVANGERDAQAAARARAAAQAEFDAAHATISGKASADAELKKFYSAVLPPDQSAARRIIGKLDQLASAASVQLGQETLEVSQERGQPARQADGDCRARSGEYRNIRRFIHALETAPGVPDSRKRRAVAGDRARSWLECDGEGRHVLPDRNRWKLRRRAPAARARAWLLGALGVAVVALVAYQMWPVAPAAPAASAVSIRRTGAAQAAARGRARRPGRLKVRLEALQAKRPDPGEAGTEPVPVSAAAGTAAAAQASCRSRRRRRAADRRRRTAAADSADPLKFMGTVEKPGLILAALTDCKGFSYAAREGEVIDGRYRW